MGQIREALALGAELSGYIIVSYYGHQPLAEAIGMGDELVLGGLLAISLGVWTFRAWLSFSH